MAHGAQTVRLELAHLGVLRVEHIDILDQLRRPSIFLPLQRVCCGGDYRVAAADQRDEPLGFVSGVNAEQLGDVIVEPSDRILKNRSGEVDALAINLGVLGNLFEVWGIENFVAYLIRAEPAENSPQRLVESQRDHVHIAVQAPQHLVLTDNRTRMGVQNNLGLQVPHHRKTIPPACRLSVFGPPQRVEVRCSRPEEVVQNNTLFGNPDR